MSAIQPQKRQIVSITLLPPLVAWVEGEALRQNRSRSWVIERCVEKAVEAYRLASTAKDTAAK